MDDVFVGNEAVGTGDAHCEALCDRDVRAVGENEGQLLEDTEKVRDAVEHGATLIVMDPDAKDDGDGKLARGEPEGDTERVEVAQSVNDAVGDRVGARDGESETVTDKVDVTDELTVAEREGA